MSLKPKMTANALQNVMLSAEQNATVCPDHCRWPYKTTFPIFTKQTENPLRE